MSKKDEVVRLLKEGKSVSEIVSLLNCSKGTVSFHRKQLGLIYENPRKSIDSFDWREIQKCYDSGISVIQCCKKYGISRNNLKESIEKKLFKINNKDFTDENVFVENSSYPRGSIKRRVIKDKKIDYKCGCCGINDEWNNKPLVLHLDHINGVNNDHRLENLRFLCPNCHTQQDTYAGKNTRNPNRVPKKYV